MTKMRAKKPASKPAKTFERKQTYMGPFTFFPRKTHIRQLRMTPETEAKLSDAGKRITNPDRDGESVGFQDVVETLAELYAPSLTIGDVVRAAKKRGTV